MRYLIALTLILVCVMPATARQWTSRSGDFSIEAELKDVRDGNAILRKSNGEEVSVPLGKLSLADIEYIKQVLREAEAGITGKPEPPAPPPAAEPSQPAPKSAETPGPKASPSAAAKLQYKWQKDKFYKYTIKAIARFGDKQEEINASVIYTVVGVADNGVVDMTFMESVGRGGQGNVAYAPRPPYPPSRHYRSPGIYAPRPAQPNKLQIDRYGRILRVEGSEYLPFMLGRAAHLPLEQLSPLNENPWTVAADVAISLSHEDWLSGSAFATLRKELLPAREKSIYKIVGREGELIKVHKSYELATVAESDGKPRVSLAGEGTLLFDPRRGVFKSCEMKMRVAARESGTTVEFPLEISYNLPSEAEMAEMQAAQDKIRRQADQLAKDMMRPIAPEEFDQLIKDMQSGDIIKIQSAVTRLTSKRPQEPNQKFAKALLQLLKSDTPMVREKAAKVLEYWATPECIPALMKLLDDDSPMIRSHALAALAQLKAVKAVDRIIKQWPKDRVHVTQALQAMGPAAEPAVLKALKSTDDKNIRHEACQVLGEIGTEKSIPVLEQMEKDSDRMVQLFAKNALRNIRRKAGKD
jgi:hypothetical protein